MLLSIELPAAQEIPISYSGGNETEEFPHLTLLFRVGKSEIDPSYMENAKALEAIERVINPKYIPYIDSLNITAFASPEGNANYNQILSQRRADALKSYFAERFPTIPSTIIHSYGLGENWEGLVRLATADHLLPTKQTVLAIIQNNNNLDEREQKIKDLNKGVPFRYIAQNYFPHLRLGASLSVMLRPDTPAEVKEDISDHLAMQPLRLKPLPPFTSQIKVDSVALEQHPQLPLYEPKRDTTHYRRPFAVKTNLLFDLATLFNIELEIPIKRRWSVLGEWIFPWWGGLGRNGGVSPLPAASERYTIQMLSGNVEVRYWFPQSTSLNRKGKQRDINNPLCGWFIGPYCGVGLYDLQLGNSGMQGEFFIAAGISGGFAHPISRYFHIEYALGMGFMQTDYRRYNIIEEYKIFQYPARYSWLGPTKAKVSLVWIPAFKVK